MVGAAHYGLAVGKRLQDPRKDKNIYTRKNRKNWHTYGLPKPAYLTGTPKGGMSQDTCLICLIQFAVAPDLMTIVAFNRDATAWGHPNGGRGVLNITFLPGEDESDLLHISSPHDVQSSLRTEFVEQELHRLGIHVTFAEDDQVSRIPKRSRALDEDPSMQGADDEDNEEADDLVAMNSDWWD